MNIPQRIPNTTISKEKNDMVEAMCIPMSYYYKGSTNCYLILKMNTEDGTISIITDYNETIAIVTSGHGLAEVLHGLDNNKYA